MKKYFTLLLPALCLFSCKKDAEAPATAPVYFVATTYKTLGTFDSTGKPNYLEQKDNISSNMLSYISSLLPDAQDLRNTHPDLLTTKAIADIAVSQKSDVFLTFVTQNVQFKNAIAFYTYPTNNPPASATDIKTITYAFPNAGKESPLTPGDKVKLGRFDPGTSIGFVLMQNSWVSAAKMNNSNVVHFCSNDVLNPERDANLKKHAVLVNYAPENKVIIGFEDANRTNPYCDNDFNDVVMYATVTQL